MKQQTTANGWLPVELGGWKSNGSINPLIRSVDHLRKVAGAEFAEAARWAAIHLHTYKLPGLPPAVADLMQNGGDWLKVDDYALQVCVESFLQDRATPQWRKREPLLTHKRGEIRTPAQFLAVHGSLDCRSLCEDIEDLLAAFSLMGSYNGFEHGKAIVEFRRFNRLEYYNANNPNNGGGAFKYFYGWEGSHVVYIRASSYCGLKVLSANLQQWRPYSLEEFAADCCDLGGRLAADENDACERAKDSLTWRLWWD